MSSTGANRESDGGTMKNVIDTPQTAPQSHTYAEDQSQSQNDQGNKTTGSTGQSHSGGNQGQTPTASTKGNEESPGGTMKNVINNPGTQSQTNTGQSSNKCSGGGADHKPGESSCGSCKK